MPERKDRRQRESLIEFDAEESGFVLEPTQVELGSGYAISVKYDEDENQVVDVKTYGEVDIAKIQKEIERVFPNVQIRHLNQKGSVTIVKKRKDKHIVKKK